MLMSLVYCDWYGWRDIDNDDNDDDDDDDVDDDDSVPSSLM